MTKQGSKSKRDGSWSWSSKANNAKILEGIAEFNAITPKISLLHNGSLTSNKPLQPTVILCQFSAIPREGGSKKKQFKLGLGECNWSLSGLELAKQRASKISLKLQHNEFTWQWFDQFIKGHKPVDELAIALSTPTQVWIDKLYATKKGKIKESSWYQSYEIYYNRFCGKVTRKKGESQDDFNTRKAALGEEYKQKPLSEQLIRNCLEATKANTNSRFMCHFALTNLLKVADLYDYFNKLLDDYESSTDYKTKAKEVPTDKRIKEAYYSEFAPENSKARRNQANVPKWQWLYGLLATYGLRVHEAWNIANWDKPVVLKDGQWVEAGDDELKWVEGDDRLIPAFNDPTNTNHVLAIKHTTKTGYRLAYPLNPPGEDWVTEFDLKGKMRLPKLKDPLNVTRRREKKGFHCTSMTDENFSRKQLEFTPHALRHAYNHRGRLLGISVTALALSLGHSETMNSSTYAKHMAIETKKKVLESQFSNTNTNQISTHLTLDEAKKQAVELAGGSLTKLQDFNHLLAAIYRVSNPLI